MQTRQEGPVNKTIKILIPVAVILFLFFAMGPFYILNEGEQAIVRRLGKITNSQTEAGLKFKVPFVDNITKFNKRILSWDGDPEEFQTAENQYIWVDTTARWKITDPVKFYESVINMNGAYLKLDEVIESAVKTVIAKNYLLESVRNSNVIIELQKMKKDTVVNDDTVIDADTVNADDSVADIAAQSDAIYEPISKGRRKLSQEMLSIAAKETTDLGIELIDVVIRQISYTTDMTESVYKRMIKEREYIAKDYISQGEGKKAEWLGKLDKDKEVIVSEAYSNSEQIKGDADALAAAIYNRSYGADPEFYEFWKAVESYKKTLPLMNKTLSTDMQYFDNFYKSE